jgi:hypothetical protein
MLTHNMYYLNFFRTLICCPRVVCLGGGCGGGGLATLLSTLPNARRRFKGFSAVDYKVVRIGLLACCTNFLVVAASFSYCLCA